MIEGSPCQVIDESADLKASDKLVAVKQEVRERVRPAIVITIDDSGLEEILWDLDPRRLGATSEYWADLYNKAMFQLQLWKWIETFHR